METYMSTNVRFVLFVVILIGNVRHSVCIPDPCAGATCRGAGQCKSVSLCSPECVVVSVCATHAYKSFERNPCRVGTPLLTSYGREVTCSAGGPPCPGGMVCLKGKRNLQGRCCHGGGTILPPEVKSGTCPTPNFSICFNFCTTDLDCTGNQKCCFNGCGRACVEAYGVRSGGGTPKISGSNKSKIDRSTKTNLKTAAVAQGTCPGVSSFGPCVQECSLDSECSNGDKCCSNGCGYTCQKPVPLPKNGTCPKDYSNDPCFRQDMCGHDSDCSGRLKCCSSNCGTRCRDPNSLPERRPGHCPDFRLNPGTSFGCNVRFDVCQADTQCPSKLKCCETGCGKKCRRAAVRIQKTGTGKQCPNPADNPNGRGSGLCVDFCSTDSDCPMTQICCMKSDKCSKICTDAI